MLILTVGNFTYLFGILSDKLYGSYLNLILLFLFTTGDAQACMSAGHCYNHGKGVSQDFDKAFVYHQKAAALGAS